MSLHIRIVCFRVDGCISVSYLGHDVFFVFPSGSNLFFFAVCLLICFQVKLMSSVYTCEASVLVRTFFVQRKSQILVPLLGIFTAFS